MDGHTVLIVHLIELVDQTHATIGEDQRAALEHPLARHRVLVHRCGETNADAPFPVVYTQRDAVFSTYLRN